MLRDTPLTPRTGPLTDADRREMARVPFPSELIVLWHHETGTRLRYRILDASEGGFRIRCTMPLLQGMTGCALTLLPEGTPVDKSVRVAWCWAAEDARGYDIGLAFF